MKKFTALLLTVLLMLSTLTACAAPSTTEPSETEQPVSAITSNVPLDTLVVGSAEMKQNFISGFGNNASDFSIETLVGGHVSTYEYTADGGIALNETVVSNVETELDDQGNKTYTFTIYDDLMWNNGEPITAKDYVAMVLFYAAPEWVEAGASSSGHDALVGYTEYSDGSTDTFSGVKLISNTEFSLTIAAENLPYFWEQVHVIVRPIHFDTYLKSCELISNENGSRFEFSEGDLLTNCKRIVEQERIFPTVTCGPYTLVSYENQTATLEVNEYFKGDLYGNKPFFKTVIQKSVPSETDIEWVINGDIDILPGVVEHEKIEAAKASETTELVTYARSGFGFLAMLCDYGVTSDVNIRWALASLIDRSAVVEHVLGGYGTTVDSEYGIGQWMYQELAADLQQELTPISFSIDAANDYLDKTEWVFEADGVTPFDRSKALADGSYIRHNQNGDKLVINHLGQTDNVLTDIIEIQYAANAPLTGIEFNVEKSDWNAVLENYYYSYELAPENRIYNTFNLATNFAAVFDRYYNWHSDYVGTMQNRAQLGDEQLDAAIIAMRECEPDDIDSYLDAWLNYQIRWNELMPQVPLYSNDYYDAAHVFVDGFNTTPYARYQDIICQMSKSEK